MSSAPAVGAFEAMSRSTDPSGLPVREGETEVGEVK